MQIAHESDGPSLPRHRRASHAGRPYASRVNPATKTTTLTLGALGGERDLLDGSKTAAIEGLAFAVAHSSPNDRTHPGGRERRQL